MYNSQKHSTSDGSNTDPKQNFQQLFWADWSSGLQLPSSDLEKKCKVQNDSKIMFSVP